MKAKEYLIDYLHLLNHIANDKVRYRNIARPLKQFELAYSQRDDEISARIFFKESGKEYIIISKSAVIPEREIESFWKNLNLEFITYSLLAITSVNENIRTYSIADLITRDFILMFPEPIELKDSIDYK